MIIGVIGHARSGKDTIAEYLIDKYNFKRYSLAQPMKEACKIIFDWDDDWVYGNLKEDVDERWGISPRQVLQHIGTEWGQYALCEAFPQFKKSTGRFMWCKAFEYWYERNRSSALNIVIPDIRFPHEVEFFRNFNNMYKTTILKVEREIDTSDPKYQHESERLIDGLEADEIVDNNGSMKALYKKIDGILNDIKKGIAVVDDC